MPLSRTAIRSSPFAVLLATSTLFSFAPSAHGAGDPRTSTRGCGTASRIEPEGRHGGRTRSQVGRPRDFWEGHLIPCPSLPAGEARAVVPGTFAVGAMAVDNVRHYGSRAGQTTVAFFEREASVVAHSRLECLQGSVYLLNTVVHRQFVDGCGGGCDAVRAVIVREDEQVVVQCHYVDGSTKELARDERESWCP